MRLLALFLSCHVLFAQPNTPRRLAPPGIAVPEETRIALESSLRELQSRLRVLEDKVKTDQARFLLPDAQIYEKAVRYALEHNEFYRTNEFEIAAKMLEEGSRRTLALEKNAAVWPAETGLIVRGYRSRIDESVQPYGLVVPAGYSPFDGKRYRLDVWLHGRDETLTELKFINERSSKPGEFTPPDTFVLHPYGRYCNAFKFAGEVDVLEAVAAVRQSYPIDESRIVLRGFSMGGAGAWHLAAHYPDRWACAAPGAGFAESQQYLRLNREVIPPSEATLWQWYDATDYALNLFNLPTVAYSGELDKQKQAADVMAAALGRERLPLIHLVGPGVEHKYEPETKRLLGDIVDTFARTPRPQFPPEVRFTTRTLRYPGVHWLKVLGLEKHWERADAWASFDPAHPRLMFVTTTNVTSLALDFRADPSRRISEVTVDQTKLAIPFRQTTNLVVLNKTSSGWKLGGFPAGMVKRPGLQGPIDDAFLESFIFVVPSGTGFHPETTAWIQKELDRAKFEWRAQFRGEVRVVKDSELTEAQIKSANLILWGDPQSNTVIRKILDRLPLSWNADQLKLGTHILASKEHVPLVIFPNPLNTDKYVVLNSGFTFRGFGSNANQTPKLPDYALVQISEPDPFQTGVKAAGFFNEQWRVE